MTDIEAFYWQNSINSTLDILPTFDMIDLPKRTPNMNYNKVTLESLNDIDFPILNYTGEELAYFSAKMLLNNDFAQKTFDPDTISSLIEKIALKYNIVSYHNFSHPFSLSIV